MVFGFAAMVMAVLAMMILPAGIYAAIKSGILAGERPLRRAGAHEHRTAAYSVLLVPVADERDAERVGGFPQQLPAQADIVLALYPAVGRDIVDGAAAARRRHRDARRQPPRCARVPLSEACFSVGNVSA